MNYQAISAALIIIVTLGLSAYDLVPALNETPGDTISAVLRQWSREWYVLAYLWGVLGGHFFAGDPNPLLGAGLGLTIWTVWILLIVNLGTRSADLPSWVYILLMIVGILAGHFFWSQA